MNDTTKELVTDYTGGICWFCGKEAYEASYSGSYETYLDCSCDARKEYYNRVRAVEACLASAEQRYNLAQKNKRLEAIKSEQERLERELTTLKKELKSEGKK